jgi:cell division protein FtsB
MLRPKPTRLLALAGLTVVGFFYWKPTTSYLDTKHALQQRQADVRALRAEKAQLTTRLAQAGTGQELVRAARRLDLVKPGEKLFIVKGIPAWRKAHRSR